MRILGNAFRNHDLRPPGCRENFRHRARVEMVPVRVRAQYQASVPHIPGAKRRSAHAWTLRPERIRKIWIDVENAVAVFQNESAVAEPPDSRRITTGVFDLAE